MSALLEVQQLCVRFPHRSGGWRTAAGSLDALDDVSLRLCAGERLGIVGESGSGKSTLARVVLGFVPATSGRVLWQGAPVDYADARALRELRRSVQIVFQDPFGSLDPRMTAGQSIAEALPAAGRGSRPAMTVAGRIEQSLFDVGLDGAFAGRYPHELSGGQCQRVAIARATIGRPRLLLCDEAVSALDVSVQAQIVNLLRDLSERHGMALLFISHNLAVVRHLCEHLAVLCRGRVVEQGDCEQILLRPRERYTRDLLAAVPEPDPRLRAG
jgi:ABC-type microcin C transport system duplicated ATPase subunit YejF